MTETPQELDPDVVSNEYVTLEREIEIRDVGVVITVTTQSKADHPVFIRVIDDFPEDATITEVGFDPNFEPAEGSINTNSMSFEGRVSPDESFVVKYGMCLADPDNATQFKPPKIDIVRPIDTVGDDISLRGGGASAGPLSEVPHPVTGDSDADEPASPLGGMDDVIDRFRPTEDEDEPDTEATDHAEDGVTPGDNQLSVPDDIVVDQSSGPDGSENFDWADHQSMNDGTETTGGTPPDWADGLDVAGDEPGEPSDTDVVSPPPEPSVDEGNSDRQATGSGYDSGGETLLSRLITELQRDDISGEKVATLRDELAIDHPKSMDVRLRYMQSQVNEFAAYYDALEKLMDRHGPPAEFADEVTDGLDAVHDELDRLHTDVSTAEESRATIEGRLDDITGEVTALEDHMDEELDSIRDDVIDRYQTLDEAMHTLETDVETTETGLDELTDEVASLETRVDEKVDALESDLAASTDELRAWTEEKLESLEGTLTDEIETTNEELTRDFEALETDIMEQVDELETALNDDLTDLRNRLDAAENDLEETIADLRGDVEENAATRRQFSHLIDSIRSMGEERGDPDDTDDAEEPADADTEAESSK